MVLELGDDGGTICAKNYINPPLATHIYIIRVVIILNGSRIFQRGNSVIYNRIVLKILIMWNKVLIYTDKRYPEALVNQAYEFYLKGKAPKSMIILPGSLAHSTFNTKRRRTYYPITGTFYNKIHISKLSSLYILGSFIVAFLI